MNRKSYKIGGLNVVTIIGEKFKTTDILLNFRNKLTSDTATARALVPYVLKAGTESFPSKKEINRELEKMYGASFGANINKQGLQQIISFKMSLVNDAYLTNQSTLLDNAFRLLHEIVFKPKLVSGVFDERVVHTEKRLLSEHFDSLYDNKIRYALDKLLSTMFSEENYRIRSIGQKEDLDDINPTNLHQTYRDILKHDAVDLFILGDIDEERVKTLIEQYLSFDDRPSMLDVVDTEDKEIREVNEVIEHQEVNQGKLNIGLRTFTRGSDDDYQAMLVLNGILGSYPHSLLFRNVREKHSLCYYISSTIDRAKGAMFIYAGVEHSAYQKALDITIQQIQDLKDGQFTEEILENTKNALINDLLEMNDSPSAVLATDFASLLYGEIWDVNKKIERIKAVTFDDVVKAAGKLKLDTIFFLTKEEVME